MKGTEITITRTTLRVRLQMLEKVYSPIMKRKDSLKSDGQQFHQYQQITSHLNSLNIQKTMTWLGTGTTR